MNVVSTAQVLPRTPADVNDLISVVFIGPGQFKPDYLGTTFRVRKAKIAAFLIFLKQNNCLYRDMEIEYDGMQVSSPLAHFTYLHAQSSTPG